MLRLSYEFDDEIIIYTVLVAAAVRGQLSALSVAACKDVLRKRLIRSGLCDVPLIGGVEVFYHTNAREWVLHVNLAVFGGSSGAHAQFAHACKRVGLYRPVVTAKLTDPPRQLSYHLKFSTYQRPYAQRGGKKSAATPLNPREHYELVCWMSQHQFADHVFLFNARRYGASIRIEE
nr:hypothetical protein CIT39_06150 [Bradyrhizobium symbiodeficiens]